MIYSHDYDPAYSPAMPVVEVQLENVETGLQGERFIAIVDSGADSCILPKRYLNAVGSEPIRRTRMVGVTGAVIAVELHLLIVHVDEIAIFGVEAVAGSDDSEAIIGRNALNQLVVTLDGIAGVTEISD